MSSADSSAESKAGSVDGTSGSAAAAAAAAAVPFEDWAASGLKRGSGSPGVSLSRSGSTGPSQSGSGGSKAAAAKDSWEDGDANTFTVRGADYLVDSLKQPSAEAGFVTCGVNVFRTRKPLANAAAVVPSLRDFIARQSANYSYFFVVVWRLPGDPCHSVVHCFGRTLTRGKDGAFDASLDAFVAGSHADRKARFKFICNITSGPWMVTTAVSRLGGNRPAILGNKLTTHHYQGANYTEVDIDVASSTVARTLNGLILGYTSGMTVDLGFLLEGQEEAHLPERMVGVTRFLACDMPSSAALVDLPDDYDEAAQPAVQ